MNRKHSPLRAKNDVTHANQLKLNQRLNNKEIWSDSFVNSISTELLSPPSPISLQKCEKQNTALIKRNITFESETSQVWPKTSSCEWTENILRYGGGWCRWEYCGGCEGGQTLRTSLHTISISLQNSFWESHAWGLVSWRALRALTAHHFIVSRDKLGSINLEHVNNFPKIWKKNWV